MQNLLSWIFLFPLAVAFALLLIPSAKKSLFRVVALITLGAQFILSIVLLIGFDSSLAPSSWKSAFQYVVKVDWINLSLASVGNFKIQYYIGVDGISVLLVALSSLVLFIGVLSSWNMKEKVKGYFFLYLLLSSSVVGCFIALDFFLFYLCFEFMLLPMFFLIGIWGGKRRSYASIKFFLYTLFGSLFILVVMIMLYMGVQEEGINTFSLAAMMDGNYLTDAVLNPESDGYFLGVPARSLAFLFLLVGFAIKLPAVPVHTWLPDAHVEAPTPISVVLAGLLLKVGGYGLFRILYGIFPDLTAKYSGLLAFFGVLSIIYGGLNALAQRDLKRMVAYSSVSHMGFVLLGLASITSAGIAGSLYHMISHGLISPALFLVVGVIYDRTHNRTMDCFSGLAGKMPVYTFLVALFFFAGMGLPTLSGFIGELMVLMGAFTSKVLAKWYGILAILGMIISAAYFIWTLQRVFFGKYFVRESAWEPHMKDLSPRELIMLIPLAVLVVLFGIFPTWILDFSNETIEFFMKHLSNSLS
ncbi:MAG: NADH-quinone oxidoreductase subunit M [Bacteroidota bacterium]